MAVPLIDPGPELSPGDRVDLVATGDAATAIEPATVAENLLVLAVRPGAATLSVPKALVPLVASTAAAGRATVVLTP